MAEIVKIAAILNGLPRFTTLKYFGQVKIIKKSVVPLLGEWFHKAFFETPQVGIRLNGNFRQRVDRVREGARVLNLTKIEQLFNSICCGINKQTQFMKLYGNLRICRANLCKTFNRSRRIAVQKRVTQLNKCN